MRSFLYPFIDYRVNVSPLRGKTHEQGQVGLYQLPAFVGEAVEIVKVFRLALIRP